MSELDLLALGVPVAVRSPFDQPAGSLADETRLDRYLAALDRPDADLDDVRNVLHVLARMPVDAVRQQGICKRLAGVLGRYDGHTRCAPPSVLTVLVGESLSVCRNDLCGGTVAPWEDDRNGCCDAACEAAWLRTVQS